MSDCTHEVVRRILVIRGLLASGADPTHRECCCTVEDGKTYCGDPACDIYYCQDCGDEFDKPCARHEGVAHE